MRFIQVVSHTEVQLYDSMDKPFSLYSHPVSTIQYIYNCGYCTHYGLIYCIYVTFTIYNLLVS